MSSRHLVYLSGPPGAGKSTLMAALTAACGRYPRSQPFAHQVLFDRDGSVQGIELGRRRDTFPGTDTLSMSVSPRACAWLATHPAELILGEGDRLATRGFLDAAAASGYTVTLVHVTAPQADLDARCTQRGSTQNDTWRRGRATKAQRLAAYAAQHHTLLLADTTRHPADVLAAHLHASTPALAALPTPPTPGTN
jgi:hypothetical protein